MAKKQRIEDFEKKDDPIQDFVTEFYGTKELRWYQVAARNGVLLALQEGCMRILIVLPTGAGKTITIASSLSHPDIRKALKVRGKRPLRVLFVSHKHRLLTQAERSFVDESGVELITHSMFSEIPDEIVEQGWDVCVLDEAHHEACMTFQYRLEQLADKPIIGLTATKDRASGEVIKFERIIEPMTREEAVEQGFLARSRIYSFVDAPERDKVEIVSDILQGYAHEMGQTMVFLRTKAEVRQIAALLDSMGYNVAAVIDHTESQLDEILNAFGRGEYQFIVNCAKINEGVDVSGCESVLLGRTYGSYPMLNQVIGRASRPDSECKVWEIINPLSATNLDTTVVVGMPEEHLLIYRENGKWHEVEFDYAAA